MQNMKSKSWDMDLAAAARYAMLAMAITVCACFAGDAYATGTAGVKLCGLIINEMGGQLGSAIATIGVLIVGVGAALGKVSWTMAVTVAVGISCMSVASSIAGSLGVGGC